jgi:death-on-curing protein
MPEPIWVLPESVKAIHKRQIAEHGGEVGIRDLGLLESPLARPQNAYLYSKGKSSIQSLAASYAFSITKNHPFIDGNKRVALVVCILFMKLNRWVIIAKQETLYSIFWDLAAGRLSEEALVSWLNSVSKTLKQR